MLENCSIPGESLAPFGIMSAREALQKNPFRNGAGQGHYQLWYRR